MGPWGRKGLGCWRDMEEAGAAAAQRAREEETSQRDGLRPDHMGLCKPQRESGFYSERNGEP